MEEPLEPDLWIREVHKGIVGLHFKVEKTLYSDTSPYQRIDVYKTTGHGNMLFNDGVIMLSERDEFIYHEMIAHVPLFVHPAPRQVLIIGGGDGGTAREILKHRGVERVVLVEIDKMVVDTCRKFFPSLTCALDDPRLDIRYEDGVRYVSDTSQRFDVIIVDSTDPIGPAEPLFGPAFYESTSRVLGPDGILVTQAESAIYDPEMQQRMLQHQRPFFKRLHLYLYSNLTYPGSLWGFGYASKGLCPIRDFDPERVAAAHITCRYYNTGIHRAAFMLPTFVAEELGKILDPVPDMSL